jgi:hypothetical protein
VPGLLIADAKTRFDTSNRQIENVAAGSAVALIVDMDHPFEGTILVSAQPMQEALGMIGTP